jgi:spore maturation protein CgeB
LKFIVPGNIYDDSFAENVAFTLRQMGHAVITRPVVSSRHFYSKFRNYYRLLRQKVSPLTYLPPEEKWLLEAAKQHRPDILLTLTQTISESTLFELKKLGVKYRVAWWGDPPAYLKQMGLLSDEWDAIFLKDLDTVAKFRIAGLTVYHLHEALNPAWHKPNATRQNGQIVVAGTFYGYRQFLVSRLLRDGIPIELYGPKLPLWALPEIKREYRGKYIVKEEKSRIFGEGLACLNSTHIAEGNSLNCRAFEIAGAGGLQLIEHKPIIQDCFEPGKELLVFNSYEELLSHIERATRFPQEMLAIRQAGAKRALAEHTYQHRLTEILYQLGEHKSGQARLTVGRV